MNLSTQLLTPCAWTLPLLEGGCPFAVALGAWELGGVNAQIIIRGAVAAQRERQ